MFRRFASIVPVVVGLLSTAVGNVALACPTCGKSIEESGGQLAEGFFYSILFMMSMPFVVFGGLALLCWLEVRKARRAAASISRAAAASNAVDDGPPSEPALR